MAERGNWLDRTILSVAPQWGARRLRARVAAAAIRGYDAAGTGRRTSGWHRSASDANAVNYPALARLRELSRDLRRNNGWARRGVRVISVNTVGWGITAKPIGTRERRAKDAFWYWDQWANNTGCDYDGRLPFSGLQRLVMETVVESGEALIMRERAVSADGLTLPIRIRVLEPDHLDTLRDGVMGKDGPIVQGVEFDSRGRRVAYWIFRKHPGSTSPIIGRDPGYVSERISAADVLHVYRVERPGQHRGVPWLASAIAKLQDYDDYDDAVLMQQKVAACFAAFVRDLDGSASYVGKKDEDDATLETLEPGQIQYLEPGKDVTFAQPPSTGDHSNFSATILRRIAASLDVTYEDLTGDYSRVNFSSARMARLAHWASVEDWRWNMLIPQFCDGVWRWAMEAASVLEGWTEIPRADWAPPPMPMLDPDKEGLAYTRMIRSGVMTLSQALRELGRDPAQHLAEIEQMNKLLDEKGIWLDSDPRRTSGAGLAQPEAGNGGAEPEPNEESEDDA